VKTSNVDKKMIPPLHRCFAFMVFVLVLVIHNKSLAELSRIFTKTLQFRFSSESPKVRAQQKKPTDFDQGRESVGCKTPNNFQKIISLGAPKLSSVAR
jgi:hypothetical protein